MEAARGKICASQKRVSAGQKTSSKKLVYSLRLVYMHKTLYIGGSLI